MEKNERRIIEIINSSKDKEAALKVTLELLMSLQEGQERFPAFLPGVS